MKLKKFKIRRRSLTLSLSLSIFVAYLVIFALSALAVYIFIKTGILKSSDGQIDATHAMLYLSGFIIIVGALFSFLISKLALIPINRLMNKINDLASGDFASRMDFGQIYSRIPAFRGLSDTFNKLAMELQNTEVLRYDFINNFSHEFKTPIVSITGFAKLLKNGNLTEEEKEAYVCAIEEESMRLSSLATNVLNLTRVENQSILSDITKYNVSEQIRSSVLILESKWAKKNIEFALDFDELELEANEEFLKQVFINLIDNAIKFSKSDSCVDIKAQIANGFFDFSITNYGIQITDSDRKKIFGKFYQADTSHSTEGNGIGLAIVKKIIDLHRGKINVFSKNNSVTFKLSLPTRQKSN